MTHVHRVAGLIFNQPLLVTPDCAATVVAGLAARLDVEPLAEIEASRFVGSPSGPRDADGRMTAMYRVEDGVALVPVLGELVNRGAWIGASSGLTSYEGLDAQLAAAELDAAVRAVVLDMNSPGGQASGAMETAARVRALATKKPVVAFVNGQAASAAYAIASGATRIVTTPSGVLGSIGVVWMHLDRSEQVAKSGVRPTLLTAGAFKADGHPLAALPDDARGRIQGQIDAIYQLFVSTVAAYRPMTEEAVRSTEAGVFMGQAAVEAGLADAVGTLADVFAFINRDRASGRLFFPGGFMTEATKGSSQPGATAETGIPQAVHDAAVAAARAEGEKVGASAERSAISAALTGLFPSDARATTFVEALADGVPVATAAKFAGKVSTGAAADVPGARLSAAVPRPAVAPDAESNTGPELSDFDKGAAEAKRLLGHK